MQRLRDIYVHLVIQSAVIQCQTPTTELLNAISNQKQLYHQGKWETFYENDSITLKGLNSDNKSPLGILSATFQLEV